MTAQLFVGFHATFEIFHHCQRIVELGIKLCNSLVECVLVEQTIFLQEDQGLCHSFEVVFFRPTLVADALTLLQLRLNIDQFPDAVRLGLDSALAFGIGFQSGKHKFFLELVTDAARPDELCPSSRQIAEPSTAFLDGNAVLLQEPVREIFKTRCNIENLRNLSPQDFFCGFKLRLCGLLTCCEQGSVFMVEFQLTSLFHPVFALAHTNLRAVEQVDLVQSGTLAHLHDLDTQVPHGLGSAGVLHAL